MTSVLGKIGELIGKVLRLKTAGRLPFPPGSGPARLLVMRHAEKTGDKSDPHLSPQGLKRAQALANYIPTQFGTPDFLIAAANSQRSRRPRETLEPLANALRINILDMFADEDADAVVAALGTQTYAGKFGVIAWRHSDIPALAAALGAATGTTPNPWDDTVFNLIIELTYAGETGPRVRLLAEPF
jgi:hypothetical protein